MAEAPRRFWATSGALLGVAHGLEMALPFVRSVAMARLMEPREFALALALSTIVAIAEITTDIGVTQLAVKHDLRDARARGTLHALAIARAALIAVALAVLAAPLARLFHEPGAAWAFAAVGVAVFIRSFSNLAVRQLGRTFNFSAEAKVIATSQIAWTLCLVALSFMWADHSAMVVSLIVYACVFVIASHIVSPARFGVTWDRAHVAEAIRFGRPLIPNGVALAITSMMDRVVIGSQRGLETLALYGPLTTSAMLPRGTALRYANNLFLPAMVRSVERNESVRPAMSAWTAALSLLSIGFGLGFMSIAEPVISLVFGERYSPTPLLVSLMGSLLVCRIFVACPVPLAVATGRTWFVTGSSAIAAASLGPAAVSLLFSGPSPVEGLTLFLGTTVAVETLGLILIVWRTRRAFPDAAAGVVRSAAMAVGVVYGVTLACHILGAESWTARLPFAIAGILAGLVMFGPTLRRFISRGNAA